MQMWELITKGFIIGILVSAPMGPVGMLCIQRTLAKGRWHGFISGLGAAFSDVIYATITGLFMGLAVNFVEAHLKALELFGCVVLAIFGYYIFRSNPVKGLQKKREGKSSYLQDFVTAFLLTLSNVLIILLYIGLFARFTFVLPTVPSWKVLNGLAGIATGTVLWWFIITYIVSKMRRWFNIRSIRVLNQIVGIVIIVLSIAGIFFSRFVAEGGNG